MDNDRVKELEKSLLLKPPTDSMILTAIIDPECNDIQEFSEETKLSYKLLVLSGNHRRAALQNIKKASEWTTCASFNVVNVDVYRGKTETNIICCSILNFPMI